MPDGVDLLSDHYFARNGGKKQPVIFIRSPYGRDSIWGITSRLVAERGYQVLIQSVRGTFGSGGEFNPELNEAKDGMATMNWLKEQEWFPGQVVMMGPSYLGYVQWAIAANSPPNYLKAIVPHITASQFRGVTYPGDDLALDTFLSWVYAVSRQEKVGRIQAWYSQFRLQGVLKPGFQHVPLNEVDKLVLGERNEIFQQTIENEIRGTRFWNERDHSKNVRYVQIPSHLIGGWYDIFLPYQLEDYRALKESGRITPHLTIGPWSHESPGGLFVGIRESLDWFDHHLKQSSPAMRNEPVRVFLMGKNHWVSLSEWPPPKMRPVEWFLRIGKLLTEEPPEEDFSFDSFDYDPKDPTPSVGGAVIGRNAGSRDNRKVESRSDVLCYSSSAFRQDYALIGPLSVNLFVQSSLENTDFFARVCDVSPNGKSMNISDGLLRLKPADFRNFRSEDGIVHINFDLWPTAHCFLKGHRMRMQVSSGSHPRFSRNLGSGEPIATAKNFVTAHQKVFHDSAHPSSVKVPFIEL
jgi:putative CocE/NonD family hydrolase